MKNSIKFIIGFFIFSFLFLSCDKQDSEDDIPNCIEVEIQLIKNQAVRNPPANVWKWVDNEVVYYYITSDCCDQFNLLYNTNCEIVCAPDGGLSGGGDGNCPNFSTEISRTLIWEDERTYP